MVGHFERRNPQILVHFRDVQDQSRSCWLFRITKICERKHGCGSTSFEHPTGVEPAPGPLWTERLSLEETTWVELPLIPNDSPFSQRSCIGVKGSSTLCGTLSSSTPLHRPIRCWTGARPFVGSASRSTRNIGGLLLILYSLIILLKVI